jgi:mono/diheme cytochrome c family protein
MKRYQWMALTLVGVFALAQTDAPSGLLEAGNYTPGTLGIIFQPLPNSSQPDSVYGVGAWPTYTPDLADGPGKELVQSYCQVCHSTTYITMQPALPATTWEAEVKKMINTYGAAIPEDAAAQITGYLQAHYTPQNRRTSPPAQTRAPGPTTSEATSAQAESDGTKVYAQCQGCHQANGAGVPGVFPPLAGHVPDILATKGGRTYLVQVLLYGLAGQINVKGQNYNGVMPAWSQLSDADLAGVLNHISTQWGNKFPAGQKAFTPDEIKAQRGTKLSAQQVYSNRQKIDLK